MPLRKKGKQVDGVASTDAGVDRISALPNDALHHILSFLPAEEAVRTCVLARRWLHLWKSATGLRIGFCNGDTPPSVESVRHFVNHLLLLRRGDSSIHTCDLRLRNHVNGQWLSDEKISLNLWIRHILEREVRTLRLEIKGSIFRFHLDKLPFVSQHLKMLALSGLWFNTTPCDFSICPNLEHLEIVGSYFLQVCQISSKSLRHLSIRRCHFCYEGSHTLISTPNVVSLKLDGHFFSVLVLGRMPSLKQALFRVHGGYGHIDNCFSCNGALPEQSDYNNKCLLLQGLSEAQQLTLMCDYKGLVFHRDLKWCPTFKNLRTLLLNEWWCLDPDFHGLNCILRHSPILEKLNLQLFARGPQYQVEMVGRYNPMERSATISKHLKEIEVKSDVLNEQVQEVLKFLGTFGIHFLFK